MASLTTVRPASPRRPARRAGPTTTTAPVAWHVFDTPLGAMALAWRGEALVGGLLPGEADPQAAAARWPEARPAAPPAWLRRVVARIARHLEGAPDDLRDVPVDLSAHGPFARAVLEAARAIPPGEVRTYGDLAAAVGRPGAARAVGTALGRNSVPLVVPCHRVVARGGLGGFSSPGGLVTKRRLLEAEGARPG